MCHLQVIHVTHATDARVTSYRRMRHLQLTRKVAPVKPDDCICLEFLLHLRQETLAPVKRKVCWNSALSVVYHYTCTLYLLCVKK